MSVTAYDVYQNAEELNKKGLFDQAEEEFQKAFKLYSKNGSYDDAIDCIIQKKLSLIELSLEVSGTIILTESGARKILQRHLSDMETEIKQFVEGLKSELFEELKSKRLLYSSLKKAYLQVERLCNDYEFTAEASKCFRNSMDYKRRLAGRDSKLQWLYLSILKVFGYGKRLWLLLVWAVLFVPLFGTLYWKFEFIEFNKESVTNYPDFVDSLYFTIVVLTTLGFGDIIPTCTQGRMVVIAEVILGYFTLGIIISIIGSKITRR